MLAIPITKPISMSLGDVTTIISSLKNQNYSEEIIKNDVKVLENLRANAISIVEPSELGQQHLLNYCQQLKHCTNRFQGLESQFKLNIIWNDAFGINLKLASNTLYLDYACCMWNLASFESLMGACIDRMNEEGIRKANKHFQQAAGYFEYIRIHLLPFIQKLEHSKYNLPSITEDGLSMVKNLMLAQAQLCFYEKAVKDKKAGSMKSAIIAKLAKQTALFYSNTSVSCKVGVLGSILDISWFAITDFQSKVFQGATEYWQAQASKENALQAGTGYGEEVVRYKRAETFLALALMQTAKYPIADSILFGARGLREAILEHKQIAEKDLHTVYMESLPKDSDLIEVSPVAMVRPSGIPTIQELCNNDINNVLIFPYVIPQDIRNLNNKYSNEIQGVYQQISSTSDNITNTGRVQLSSLGLPGSLEAERMEGDLIPASICSKLQRVQSMGGFDRLQHMLAELKTIAQRTLLSMANIDDSLDREESIDNDFRVRYKDFNGNPSNILNTDIRSNTLLMREAYTKAQTSDKDIETELNLVETQEDMKLLALSKDEMIALFPTKQKMIMKQQEACVNLLDFEDDQDINAINSIADKDTVLLEEKLHKLADIIEIRCNNIQMMKSIIDNDINELSCNLLSKIFLTSTVNYSTVVDNINSLQLENINKMKLLQEQNQNGFQQQDILLKDIIILNEKFIKSIQNNPLTIERNKIISKIEQSIAKYLSLHSQLTAGITFYASLQSKLTTLLQSRDDLAYMQLWTRQEFETQRTVENERHTQEQRDRELAMSLQQEQNHSISPPVPIDVASGGPYVPAVYGTPVSGPPGGYLLQPSMPPTANNNNMTNTSVGYIPSNQAAPPSQSSYYPALYPPPQQQQQQQQQQQSYNGYNTNTIIPPSVYLPPSPHTNNYNVITNNTCGSSSAYAAYPGQQLPPPHMQYQTPLSNHIVPLASDNQYQQSNTIISANSNNNPYQQQYNNKYQPPLQQGSTPMIPLSSQSPPQSMTTNSMDMQIKIARLCEMGFPADKVALALQANNSDEEAALNSLLSSSNSNNDTYNNNAVHNNNNNNNNMIASTSTITASATNNTAVPVKQKSSGLFGKMWGSN